VEGNKGLYDGLALDGANSNAALARLLGLPDSVVPLGFIVIGHPAQELAPQDRYDEAKVHWNGW